MPKILSVSTFKPPHEVHQEQAVELTRGLFNEKFNDIERLLRVFQNGDIETRNVCMPLDWYGKEHDFEERNQFIYYNMQSTLVYKPCCPVYKETVCLMHQLNRLISMHSFSFQVVVFQRQVSMHAL